MQPNEPPRWDHATTEDLLAAAQGGQWDARETLFERYRPRVLALARGRLGRQLRRALDSQDLVQEALVEAAKDLERFEWRGESSLIRWLARLLEHRVTTHADRQATLMRDVRREVPLDPVGSPTHHGKAPTVDDPLRQAARAEDAERLRAALDQLPANQREALLLRHYGGCTWEEVAEELGVASADAARMLHVRAAAKLGRLLGE